MTLSSTRPNLFIADDVKSIKYTRTCLGCDAMVSERILVQALENEQQNQLQSLSSSHSLVIHQPWFDQGLTMS